MQQRQKDCVVEVRIEAEFVDGVVAHHPLADELGGRSDPLGEFGRGVLGRRCARDCATPMVYLTDDGGDLLGRSAASGVREQGGMSARAFGALGGSAPLGGCSAPRIRVQRNDFGFGFARHVDTFSPPDYKILFYRPHRCAADTARLSIERTHFGSMIGVNPRPRT